VANVRYAPEYPAVEWIVAGEGDHGSEGNADGVEDLCRGIHPHLHQVCILLVHHLGATQGEGMSGFVAMKQTVSHVYGISCSE